MMRSSNPAMGRDVFIGSRGYPSETMTVNGTVNKCLFLLTIVFITAMWSWQQTSAMMQSMSQPGELNPMFPSFLAFGGIGAFVVGLITVFFKKAAPYTAPIYALCEGLLMGAFSTMMELRYPGIVVQAVLGTFGTFFFMLFAYKNEMIRATEGFQKGMMAAMGGVMFIYLISFVMNLFGKSIPYIHQSGPIGIGFSVVVVGIAAFSFILDFHNIEQGERYKAPKYLEWYGAFGILVTLIWLYVEILNLLSKLRDRR